MHRFASDTDLMKDDLGERQDPAPFTDNGSNRPAASGLARTNVFAMDRGRAVSATGPYGERIATVVAF